MAPDNANGILKALEAMERERNVPKEKIFEALQDALQKAYEKHFGANQDVIVEIDRETGEFNIWQRKLVVPVVEDKDHEMSLEEAQQLSDDAEVGMELDIHVPNESFGRIAAQTAKQVILQRMRELERDRIRNEFTERRGQILRGTIARYDHRDIVVELSRFSLNTADTRAEGIIPVAEQAHNEYFRIGDEVRALVIDVHEGQRGPQIMLSRSSPQLLKCLFESQVPEIEKGIVQIKAVVREAGLRSKIAVKSNDAAIDPVGACVGPKGSRVQGIVEELKNEKIDVIPWSEDTKTFISNSLQPSRVTSVTLNKEQSNALVVVPDQQLPLAIGREGQNARLAAKLTGWHIDIKSESAALAEMKKADAAVAEEATAEEPVTE